MNQLSNASPSPAPQRWLTRYYTGRGVFSLIWVAAAFGIGLHVPVVAAVLLVIYPAWDALANVVDAKCSGGLARNRSQAINALVSGATTIAVLIALRADMHAVLQVYGAWAIAAGLLQLGAAIARRKSVGGQWAMMLSGAQSALAGGLFLQQALKPEMPSIDRIAGYAAVGAVYFLLSALWLAVGAQRRKRRSIMS